MQPRVLFICKSRGTYTQGRFGLWNSASFVIAALKSADIEASIVEAIDANCVDRLVTENKPDIVILEAFWVAPEKMQELALLHPAIKFIVRCHSKTTFLATEGTAFDWITKLSDIPGVFVAGNNLDFAQDLTAIGLNCLYLPNIYLPTYRFIPTPIDDGWLHIGCFGAPRPMKNQVAQAIAAIMFANKIGKKMAFHVNVNTLDPGTMATLSNLRGLFSERDPHKLVEHEWQDHEKFSRLVASMDLGMQVSLSESYNIVSADFVWNSVPIVVSEEIVFVEESRRCKNHTGQMVEALRVAYEGKHNRRHVGDLDRLVQSNHDALKQWLAVLQTHHSRKD